jgi:hypothetical protein
MPDLTLWNAEQSMPIRLTRTFCLRFASLIKWLFIETAKLVEVKGPRDKLSDKQRIWIDILVRAGADVEVLWVREKMRDGEVDDSADICIEVPNDDADEEGLGLVFGENSMDAQ